MQLGTLIHADIETRSYGSVKTLGAWAYSVEPSTDVWCVCFRADGDPGDVQVWQPGNPVPEIFNQSHTVIAHNYAFEQAIWMNILGPRYGWPQPITYRCTMALAHRYNLPASLENLGKRLGLTERKDDKTKRLMQRMANRSQYDENKEGSVAHRRHFMDICQLISYCKQDVRTEEEAWRWFERHGRIADKVMDWEGEFELDRKINKRGIKVDKMTASAIDLTIRQEREKVFEQMPAITGGAVEKPTQVGELTKWLQTQGYQDATLAADRVEFWLTTGRDQLTPNAIAALEARQKTSLGSIAKFAVMLRASPDGRMRGLFQLYGASQTGRWAGRLVQFQNLPRMNMSDTEIEAAVLMFRHHAVESLNLLFGDAFKVAKKMIRPSFTADDGLVVSDLGQIECRVVAWLSGCTEMLQILRDKDRDPYKEMAHRIFNKPVADIDKDERQLGKCAILGLGFSMGAQRFMDTVKSWTGIDIPFEESKRIVDLFRYTFDEIVKFWKNLESQIHKVLRNPEAKGDVGKLTVFRSLDPDEVFIQLPSGRTLHYPEMQFSNSRGADGRPYLGLRYQSAERGAVHAYGGLICENVTQAVARDVLMNAMRHLDAAGYDLVGHVHDEALIENVGQIEVDNINQIMTTCPWWGQDLPLVAETAQASRYTK